MPAKRKRNTVSDDSPDGVSSGVGKKKTSKVKTEKDGGSLSGLRICITGITTGVPREKLQEDLEQAGVSVTSAVSGVTNILVCGTRLEDGRAVEEGTKYKKAKDLIEKGSSKGDLQILTEDEFIEKYKAQLLGFKSGIGSNMSLLNEGERELERACDNFLWTERWRPTKESDFTTSRAAYESLKGWLASWFDKVQSDPRWPRACLLVGPPGVGKTSVGHAVAKQLGFTVKEFNASDTRSQKQLKGLGAFITGGLSLTRGGATAHNQVVLMDEADGLGAGDRGGSQELGRLIKMSKVPIICTGNDTQHPKVRALSKLCKIIQFYPADKRLAVNRVLQIVKAEGSDPSDKNIVRLVEDLYDRSPGDMRQLITALQMALMGASGKENRQMTNPLEKKDHTTPVDPFVAVRELFRSVTRMGARERLDIFFVDYSIVPLIVYENGLKALNNNNSSGGGVSLLKGREICDCIAYADRISDRIRLQGQWELLPEQGFFSTILPAVIVGGSAIFRIDFPKILGRISSQYKHKRQIAELNSRIGRGGNRTLCDGYYELLGDILVKSLVENCKEENRFEQFSHKLRALGITKEHFVENLMDTRISKHSVNPYDTGVDAKTKAQLSRWFKNETEPGQVIKGGGSKGGKNKKTSSSPSPSVDEKLEEEANGDGEEEENREEEAKMGSIY